LEEPCVCELTVEQVEKLCEIGEKAARDCVLSKVPLRRVLTLDITIDAEGKKPLLINVEVEITLSPLMKGFDAEKLTKEATAKAFSAITAHLREQTCKFTK
jgi:hypothetical protein